MSRTPSRKLQTRNQLREGETYVFKIRQQGGDFQKKTRMKSMKCIRKYRQFALFESPSGIRECFDYWILGKMLAGEWIEG